ncbi:conserved hypothetical protein [Tenacibaculum sp. 190524A02b]|uniref:Outer membrane protein beta-barrel domain-containing protein n=1 Tax=Tenacibaculum vairaonense TaxID=3137860 RepID=A0ABM9PGV9_9FLAO
MKKAITFIFSVFFITISSKAQELENIILAKGDAEKLTEAYLNPAMKGLIYSINGGWYHTAKVHKKLGFDITIGANVSFIPEKDEIFNLAALNLSSNSNITNAVATSPTVAGSQSITPAEVKFTLRDNQGNEIGEADFALPKGVKEDLPANAVAAPVIQVGLGLPFKLEAMLRYVPKLKFDDVKAGLFGIGLKKEITDWFGPMDKTPLHVSLLASYTNMSADYLIENRNTGSVSTQNAAAEFDLNAYSIQAIASLNFPIINIYGGIGYNGGNTSLGMVGSYTLSYQSSIPAAPSIQETITNPLSIKNNTGSFNTTIGARLSLGFFKLFGSYTLQEYNTLNAGIAFSFR